MSSELSLDKPAGPSLSSSIGQQPDEVKTLAGVLVLIRERSQGLEVLANDILWRVCGLEVTPPTSSETVAILPTENRFLHISTEIASCLNAVEAILSDAVESFDREFGV